MQFRTQADTPATMVNRPKSVPTPFLVTVPSLVDFTRQQDTANPIKICKPVAVLPTPRAGVVFAISAITF